MDCLDWYAVPLNGESLDQKPDFTTTISSGEQNAKLLEVAAAQAGILDYFSPASIESISIKKSNGRFLAEPIFAEVDLPLFSNSSMDGFAVRTEDILGTREERPTTLKIIADIPAGHSKLIQIKAGEAARIMTGAPIPAGADRVVPIENTNLNNLMEENSFPEKVTIYRVDKETYIRPVGQDVRKGDRVLTVGKKLRAQEIGFLSMLGVTEISVYRKPRIGIVSSGDELIPIGTPLTPGKIFDSNSRMLASLCEDLGAEIFDFGIMPDREDLIRSRLDEAANENLDLIISTAGVSVGGYDLVRKIISQKGKLIFWRINMRPGKPFLFGNYNGVPYFGLPGNPVSAYVSFFVFIRPVIHKLLGSAEIFPTRIKVKLEEPIYSDGRESYLRAIIDFEHGYRARLTGDQGSGNLRSLVQANALLIVPSGVKSLPIGAEVDAWLLS